MPYLLNSHRPSTRFRAILNFPIFRKHGASLELLNITFENSLPKGFYNELKKIRFFSYGAGFSIITVQQLLGSKFSLILFVKKLMIGCS